MRLVCLVILFCHLSLAVRRVSINAALDFSLLDERPFAAAQKAEWGQSEAEWGRPTTHYNFSHIVTAAKS